MASTLVLRHYMDLPFHPEGDFDHGDVFLLFERLLLARRRRT